MEIVEKYNKILISRYSPENNCYVQNGEPLIIIPKLNIPLKDHVPCFFVSAKDKKTKSKYGWVKLVEEFELKDFIDKYVKVELTTEEITSIKIMLDSIVKYSEDTSVTATYSQKSFDGKEMKLNIHKIIFYSK